MTLVALANGDWITAEDVVEIRLTDYTGPDSPFHVEVVLCDGRMFRVLGTGDFTQTLAWMADFAKRCNGVST